MTLGTAGNTHPPADETAQPGISPVTHARRVPLFRRRLQGLGEEGNQVTQQTL